MKIIRNKKGAALVSVLIGILFIAILASSLLYMSTMNSQMKSMHQFSTDNFYSAEYALDDMLAQLKQFNSIKSDPHGALETLLKTSNGTMTIFNESNLMDLIDISYIEGLDTSFGRNGVEISTIYKDATGAYTQSTYVDDGNYIHLRGVQITVKTDEAHGNYKSTITTDIDFGFPARGGSTAGLNDFSVLTDSCIHVNGGSQHFCGDLYCRKNGKLKPEGLGLDCALQVDDHSIVSMLGGFCFLDGDIYVKNGGSLYIAGNCYVKGKIYVEPQGQLNVGGRLYAKGTGNEGGGEPRAIGGGQLHLSDTTVDWDYYDDNFGDGLAHQLLSNEIHFHLNEAATSMEFFDPDCHGTSKDFTFSQQLCKREMNAGTNETGKIANGTYTTSSGATKDVHVFYLTNGVNHDFNDTLILSPIGTTSFHGNTYNCTWVCTCDDGCMSIGESGGTAQNLNIWGNMDDASYEAAKKLFFQAEWPNNYLGGQVMKFGGQGLSTDDLVPIGGADAEAIGTEFTLGSKTVVYYTHGDSLGQKYYHETGISGDQKVNYIPFECFLDDELEVTLGKFRNGLTGEGSTDTPPTIYINNWTKE